MPLQGTYEPSAAGWVREQVERFEATDGAEANTLRDTGLPIVVVTMLGASSRNLRKVPVMRVEHSGSYVMVASKGGSPEDPAWVANLRAHPHVELQDGAVRRDYTVRELTGEEYDAWWARAAEAFPTYDDYKARTDRVIPVFLLEPAAAAAR